MLECTDLQCAVWRVLINTFDSTLCDQHTVWPTHGQNRKPFLYPGSSLMLSPSHSLSTSKRLVNITYFYFHRLVFLFGTSYKWSAAACTLSPAGFGVILRKVSWKWDILGKLMKFFLATPVFPAQSPSCHCSFPSQLQ